MLKTREQLVCDLDHLQLLTTTCSESMKDCAEDIAETQAALRATLNLHKANVTLKQARDRLPHFGADSDAAKRGAELANHLESYLAEQAMVAEEKKCAERNQVVGRQALDELDG